MYLLVTLDTLESVPDYKFYNKDKNWWSFFYIRDWIEYPMVGFILYTFTVC